jgi:thioesterase domain-containing protein
MAMAIDYASLVESACEPPYELFGWSMGGLIAHAMAAELERRGAIVDRVTMIDARVPGRKGRIPNRAFALMAWLLEMQPSHSLEDVQAAVGRHDLVAAAPDRLLRLLEDSGLVPKETVTASELERDLSLYERHFMLTEEFERQPVRAAVDQWWAEPAPDASSAAVLFGAHVHQHVVPGTHFSVIQPPAIEMIAATLAAPPRRNRPADAEFRSR